MFILAYFFHFEKRVIVSIMKIHDLFLAGVENQARAGRTGLDKPEDT